MAIFNVMDGEPQLGRVREETYTIPGEVIVELLIEAIEEGRSWEEIAKLLKRTKASVQTRYSKTTKGYKNDA